jgi:hypothetical protein
MVNTGELPGCGPVPDQADAEARCRAGETRPAQFRTKRAVRVALMGVAAAGVVIFAGCSTATAVRVQPWERSYLADPIMDPNRDPAATAMTEHVYDSREAAQGGRGVGGAGCGCN